MKTRHLSLAAVLFIALVFLLSAANFIPAAGSEIHAASMQFQPTVTPPAGETVIGSTDGVMLMGVVISAIALLPLLFRKK